MSSVVCTLFEGDYHFGVAALVNSLYHQGFRGSIYAGFKGSLPPWAAGHVGGQFSPVDGLTIHFVPMNTSAHLTNCKPDFMLSLWQSHCQAADRVYYFDPDIVVKCRWTFFEEWAENGVAVCADVNPQMHDLHPIRHAWRRFFEPNGFRFVQRHHQYFNGGFVGVSRPHQGFLSRWSRLQELMSPVIGGMHQVNVGDRTFLFCKTDQDALNAAIMCSEEPVSPVGSDGMDFQAGGGGYIMSHAAGGQKPWCKLMLGSMFRGRRPSRADKQFFKHLSGPIRPYSKLALFFKKLDINLASAIGRFFG